MKIIVESEEEKKELLALSQYLHDFTFFNDIDDEGNVVMRIVSRFLHSESMKVVEEGKKPIVVYQSTPDKEEAYQIGDTWYCLDTRQSPLLNILMHIYEDYKYVVEERFSHEGNEKYTKELEHYYRQIAEHEKITVDEAKQRYYILNEKTQEKDHDTRIEKEEILPEMFNALENNLWKLAIKEDDAGYIAKA